MLVSRAGFSLRRIAADSARNIRAAQRVWMSTATKESDEDGGDDFSKDLGEMRSDSPQRGGERGGGYTDESKRKIFVGNLAWATDENSLSRGFSHLGNIVDSRVVRSPHDQRSRGFGFVTFEDESSAERALREMEGAFIDGRDIRVQPAKRRENRSYNRSFPDDF
mmetsp:Transcript_12872/g.39592  ORF Transcript_12872/g.39592 Transcript_12872/m.39592 type:complete len:165 (+) Transcript_12872:178-672(+)|eukprot:CAMPEP_0198725554 /NCGR_PEP_ID=MMETSP1475-20131203/2834_1 /TAXON_ID= ORGANISM="Unidentified sp., Strain CCMP1999" /NCGR_SAMPLE_ID=MMETSP1475 /ASSEMBLY_ACC=CAM_ASM_001111 /LENGTH=164 /DNA_ID=CAMNT_0044487349 /DNA_START=180 /DNA_END=674 /DNA_ORIENTATION=+